MGIAAADGLVVLAVVVAWIAVSAPREFPAELERIFAVLVAALTLGMVFVIQHTQARQQAATQANSMRSFMRCPRLMTRWSGWSMGQMTSCGRPPTPTARSGRPRG